MNSPPYPTFFAREGKKEIETDGPFEEKWLNYLDSWSWEQKKIEQKRKKLVSVTDIKLNQEYRRKSISVPSLLNKVKKPVPIIDTELLDNIERSFY